MRIVRTRDGFEIRLWGIPALVVLFFVFFVPYILIPDMSDAEVKQRIKLMYKTDIAEKYMKNLTKNQIPDKETAEQWNIENQNINKIQFLNIEVKRPIPDCLKWINPTYVVKVSLIDADNSPKTVYYWLSYTHFDREISSIAWYFSI